MSTPDNSHQLQTPCRKMRSKAMYYPGYAQEDDECSSGVFWCGKTQENFGPDGQPVSKAGCCAGRGCYVG